MSFFSRLAGLFTRGGRDDSLLSQAMEHAKGKRPEKALAIYNSLIDAAGTRSEVKARALFNRALAYSSLNDDEQAIADLEQVLAMPNIPENVQNAAKSQLLRVRKRVTK
jgi:tetratricopeptide (TPR) repeat protein